MKKNALLFSLLLTFSFFCNLAAQDYTDWKVTNPTFQVNQLGKIQIIDANTWITVGSNGTFMKTTNAGVNWYYHHQAGLPNPSYGDNIGAVNSMKFWDANNGIITGDAGYIAKTNNGGVTFTQVGAGVIPSTQRARGIQFVDQNFGYIYGGSPSGGTGVIAKTTDGGTTWTSVYTNATASITSMFAINAQVVVASTVYGGIVKTTNGGTTWDFTDLLVPQSMMSMVFIDANTGLVTGSGGLMSKTTDGGANWFPVTTPQSEWAYFQIKLVSPTELYLVGDPNYIYKTTDLGTTWSSTLIDVIGPTDTYIWYSLDVSGSLFVISGDFGVVGKSTNSGSTWSSTQINYTTQLMFDVKQFPGTNRLIAVGRQWNIGVKQIFISTNGGLTWNPGDTGIDCDFQAISVVNSTTAYICGTKSIVAKTTDGGVSWTQITNPVTGTYTLYNMEFVNATTGWVFINYSVPATGNIYVTKDGGLTWTPQTTGTTDGIMSADMYDANVGYCSMNPSNKPIYKTTDGGLNWLPVTTPFTSGIRAISVIDANTVYIAQGYGTNRVAKTTNGGTTWSQFALPVSIDVNSMSFKDANIGYVSGNTSCAVARTSNGGTSWTYQNLHIPTLVKVYATPGDTVFALGTYSCILRNVKNAVVPVELTSFTAQLNNSSVVLNWNTATELNNKGFDIEKGTMTKEGNISFVKIGFVNGAGTSTKTLNYSYTDQLNGQFEKYYYRLKQIDYDGSFNYSKVIETGSDYIPGKFLLSQNYPNPFNPSTSIQYSIPVDSKVKIEVYDVIGKLVDTIVDEFKPAGMYEVKFNPSGLASGVYIYKLSAGANIISKKMSFLK